MTGVPCAGECQGSGYVSAPVDHDGEHHEATCDTCGGSGTMPTAEEIAALRRDRDVARADLEVAVQEQRLLLDHLRAHGLGHPWDTPPGERGGAGVDELAVVLWILEGRRGMVKDWTAPVTPAAMARARTNFGRLKESTRAPWLAFAEAWRPWLAPTPAAPVGMTPEEVDQRWPAVRGPVADRLRPKLYYVVYRTTGDVPETLAPILEGVLAVVQADAAAHVGMTEGDAEVDRG